jgi:hypothetical protein
MACAQDSLPRCVPSYCKVDYLQLGHFLDLTLHSELGSMLVDRYSSLSACNLATHLHP